MYETQEREMDGMCGSLHRRHCCIKDKFAQISCRCTSHACSWVYHTYGISWHRIIIVAQVDAHTIDNTSDGCSVACTPAVQSYNSSVITHSIIYLIAPDNAIMTYMTFVPMIFPAHTFITNTINPSGDDSFQSAYSITSELSIPILTLTHSPFAPPLHCCPPQFTS